VLAKKRQFLFEVRFNLVHGLQEKHYRIKEFSLFWAQTRVDQENGRAYGTHLTRGFAGVSGNSVNEGPASVTEIRNCLQVPLVRGHRLS
jgi:hypothetical protein